jgi:pectate lyase
MRRHVLRLLGAGLAVLGAALSGVAAEPFQGFGADTPGGTGHPVVAVTTLADGGRGSLREALRGGGHRTIVFEVGGDIALGEHLFVSGPYVTIDGFSAPAPGITLRGRGLVIRGNRGAHDVIVRGLRVRDSRLDGIQIGYGAYNVVIDHVSVDGSRDGNLDITQGAHDVTVAWSILSGNDKNALVKFGPSRVSLHHNVFAETGSRNPQVRTDDAGTPAADTTVDLRNNVIASWRGYGTLIWHGPRANVVGNYYTHGREALTVTAARVYARGNVSGDGTPLDHRGGEPVPFAAPHVDTLEACAAAAEILGGAGARPLDARDEQVLGRIALGGCR